MKFKCKRY